MNMPNTMFAPKTVLVIVIASFFTIIFTEGLLQAYVYYIAEKGRLFEAHSATGWRTLPNLNIIRKNTAGARWHIKTDEKGFRNFPQSHVASRRRVLILGDSFAFGEGVNIAERFDYLLHQTVPELGVINTGTMGFGTDQQYLASRHLFSKLSSGDAILILFYTNDFFDVLRKRFSLRPRPYFKAREAEADFDIVYPNHGVFDLLRDKSYMLSLLGAIFERRADALWDFELAQRIIENVLLRIDKEKPRDVHLVLAYHGWSRGPALPESVEARRLCRLVELCIDLDIVLSNDDQIFLPDGHWTAAGHAQVARLLAKHFAVLLH